MQLDDLFMDVAWMWFTTESLRNSSQSESMGNMVFSVEYANIFVKCVDQ